MIEFAHEKMKVYKAAVEFVELAETIVAAFPRGRAYLADQLRRSAASVVLNIAEGAGEFRPLEKARFYRTSLRSTTESAAVIDVCERVGAIDRGMSAAGRTMLDAIVGMLTKLIAKMEERAREGEGERI